jgi:hypothetical protein
LLSLFALTLARPHLATPFQLLKKMDLKGGLGGQDMDMFKDNFQVR